jgi:hypothetical protein
MRQGALGLPPADTTGGHLPADTDRRSPSLGSMPKASLFFRAGSSKIWQGPVTERALETII